MIIRVRTHKGQQRFKVDEKASLHDLLIQMANEYQIPPQNIYKRLYHDQARTRKIRTRTDPHVKSLSSLDLKHGSMIFFDIPKSKNQEQDQPKLPSKLSDFGPPPTIGPRCTHPESVRCQKCFDSWHKVCRKALGVSEEDSDVEDKASTPPDGAFGSNTLDLKFLEWKEQQKMRIRGQKHPHSAALSLSNTAASMFQAGLHETMYTQQRYGLLLGRVEQSAKGPVTFVEVIHEPLQTSILGGIQLAEGSRAEHLAQHAEFIAAQLGLEVVGFAFTHLERPFVLSAEEVATAARMTLRHGRHVCVLRGRVKETRGEKYLEFDSFQVSGQAVKLAKRQQIIPAEPSDPPSMLRVTDTVLVESKDTTLIDTAMLCLPLPIRKHSARAEYPLGFPPLSRPAEPTLRDLKAHLSRNSGWRGWSDFNVLMFLAGEGLLDPQMDIPEIIIMVRNKQDDGFQRFEEKLSIYFSSIE
eukprot:gnl/Dysnectes_brevis/1270_a1424_1971.p1 GENE.gnl/Dysnectes_brevis/1270_a1424_1971~~gnl/Dysnectes_brevis/1270_a1424_1971.p1  ORF type:complete len:468 (-),score=75.42 gnl/Dysnectes_brevis/1270_a1424_1971:443-1846(-)